MAKKEVEFYIYENKKNCDSNIFIYLLNSIDLNFRATMKFIHSKSNKKVI